MFNLFKKLEHYYPTKIITAADLNIIIDRLNRLENLSGDQQIQVSADQLGTYLSLSKYIPAIKRFRLYGGLSVGGTAEGNLVYLDENGIIQILDSVPDILVKDRYGQHFGFEGDYGFCFDISDRDKYFDILSIHHIARCIKFRLVDSLTRFTDKAEAIVTQWSDGYKPTANVDVYNMEWTANDIYEFSGETDSVGYAMFDDILRRYNIWQIQCGPVVESSASL